MQVLFIALLQKTGAKQGAKAHLHHICAAFATLVSSPATALEFADRMTMERVYFRSWTDAVGDETQRVEPGDCILIPSGEPHGLKNDGGVILRYFRAAAPA